MEAQLLEYRRKRENEQNSQRSVIKKFLSLSVAKLFGNSTKSATQNFRKEKESVVSGQEIDKNRYPADRNSSKISSSLSDPAWKPRFLILLYVVLWLVLWKFFIEIQFGAVYFILSVSYICYKNTRTGPRDPTKLSAYSVFNANQERLDGTFTTEQFEKELRFGAGTVK